MTKPIIHFSHANGFPAETYQKFFHYLQDDFRMGYISMHGHNPKYPVKDNWNELVQELITYLEKNYRQPVIGVGHSLGGLLTFIAATLRPELFRSIVLLDSPVPGQLRSKLMLLVKKLKLMDTLTPANRAKKRRTEWSNLADAIAYFHSKTLFKHFDPDCLRDYAQYGTEPSAHGIKLRFDRDVEYQIFRTMPHDLPKYKKQLKVPAALIYGRNTKIVKPQDMVNMQKNFHIKIIPVRGGHLFPLEYPELAAKALKNAIVTL